MNRQSLLSTVKTWLRWVAVLPGALLVSLVVQATVKLWNTSMLGSGFIAHLGVETISGLALGGVFILVGVWIAPSYKKQVSLVLLCIAVMTIGASFVAAFQVNSGWWPVWSGVCVLVGALTASYEHLFGESNVQSRRSD